MMKTERYLTGYEAAKERNAQNFESFDKMFGTNLAQTSRKFWDNMFQGIRKEDIDWSTMKVKR